MSESDDPIIPIIPIIVVSGLPRSGTSMIMQMLAASGFEMHTDGVRSADIENPNGYFEHEDVKRLKLDAGFLMHAQGKVVKVVAPLLRSLPTRHVYRVILVERAIEEVLASQTAMLERSGEASKGQADRGALAEAFRKVASSAHVWLEESSNVDALHLAHRDILDSPAAASLAILNFLGRSASGVAKGRPELVLRMAAVVDPRLYRQRL